MEVEFKSKPDMIGRVQRWERDFDLLGAGAFI
jgi:hypothetical protein